VQKLGYHAAPRTNFDNNVMRLRVDARDNLARHIVVD
jgi:hypothetical protein